MFPHNNFLFVLTILLSFSFQQLATAQQSPEDIEYTLGAGGEFNSNPDAEFAFAINPLMPFPALPVAGELSIIVYLPTSQVTGNEEFTVLDDLTNGGSVIYQGPGFPYIDGNTYFSFVYSGSGINLSNFNSGAFSLVFSVDVANGTPGAVWQVADGNTSLFPDFGTRSAINVLGFNELVRDVSQVLPVELVAFQARLLNNRTQITWQTASEVDSDFFAIERSTNGRNFQTINIVPAAGYSESLIDYTAWDEDPAPGTNYYRLRQVDFDGSFDLSDLRLVEVDQPGLDIVIYPNPSSDFVRLRFPEDIREGQLQVFNAKGQIVLRQPILDPNNPSIINVQNWGAGSYIFQVTSNSQSTTSRLIVTKN